MARLCMVEVVFCKLSICKGFLKLPTVARVESCRFVKRMKEKHCFGLSIDFWRQWTLITVIRVLSYRRECRIAMLVLTEGKGKLQILLISITFSNHLICKRACKICCKLTLSQISVLLLGKTGSEILRNKVYYYPKIKGLQVLIHFTIAIFFQDNLLDILHQSNWSQ